MKVSKKLFLMVVLLLAGFVLVACDPTTEATTAAPTTAAPTTAAPTTVAPTTVAPTTVAPTLAELIADLEAFYAVTIGADVYVVQEDIPLLGTIGGVTVTWSSSDTDLVEDSGVIHKPSFTDGNQTAVLTATITIGEESLSTDFFAEVIAAAKSDLERAEEALMTVAIFPVKEYWSSLDNDSLVFLETATDDDDVDYAVTWSSSHPTVITAEGVIIQPDGAAQLVTMTATITINDVEYTEEVDFNVAASPVVDHAVDTIAAAIALYDDENPVYVKITGVTIVGVDSDDSVLFTDGTDILFVYSPKYTVEIGNVYDMYGLLNVYNGSPQLVGTEADPLYAMPSLAAVSELPAAGSANVLDIIRDSNNSPDLDNLFSYEAYEVTGNLYYNADLGEKYCVFLVPTDFDYDSEIPEGEILPTDDSIMIYYKSDLDVLKAYHGQTITIDIIMVGWRSDKLVFYADFFGTDADIEYFFETNADRVGAALNKVDFPKYILEDTTLDLSATEFDAAITYASDNAIIDATTGAVDLTGVTTAVDVTITVTATYDGETATKDVVIPVGVPAVATIADVLAGANGYLFKVEGTVVAGGYHNLYFIEDASGNIAISLYDSAMKTTLEDNVGNVVEVLGVRDVYNGLYQLKPEAITYVQDGTPVTAANIDLVALDSTGLAMYQSNLVELTGMVVTEVDIDKYDNINISFLRVSDQEEIEMRWDSRYDLPTDVDTALKALAVGDKVDLVTVLSWYYGPQLIVTATSSFTETALSDADAALLDAYLLEYGGTLYAGTTVTLPAAGTFGSTIAWAITADVEIAASITSGVLTLTRPAVDAVVTIEATVTMNAVVETKTFTYNLVALTDLVDAPAAEDEMVVVHGNIYAIIEGGFFIEDSTGKLYVFIDEDSVPYSVGDEVELVGTINENYGLIQLIDVEEYATALSTLNDVTQTPMAYDPGVTVLVTGETYSITGTVSIEGSYNNVFINIDASNRVLIHWDSPELSLGSIEDMVGEVISIDVIYFDEFYDDSRFVFTGLAGDLDVVVDFTTLHANDGTDWTIANGEEVFIQGVISGIDGSNVYIQDASGVGFGLYKPATYDSTLVVGDQVIFFGELDENDDNRTIEYANLIQKVDTGNVPVVMDYLLADLVDITIENSGTSIKVTGLVYTGTSYGRYTFEATDGTDTIEFQMYPEDGPDWFTTLYAINDVLPEVTFIYTGHNYYGNEMINFLDITMSEQDKFDIDKSNIPSTIMFTEDLVIVDGEFGSTYEVISITGDAATYLDFTTPGSILFTEPVSDMLGEMVVRVTLGTITEDVTVDVVAKAPIADGTVFIETFTNLSEGGSYADGSFTGDNGIDWTYTESRGDLTLDGTALMLRNNTSVLSATVAGGIDTFELTYYDAYSNPAQVELWINDVLIDTSASFDEDETPAVLLGTFTVTGIDVEGEFVIEIIGANAQTVIDNMTWTSYIAPTS